MKRSKSARALAEKKAPVQLSIWDLIEADPVTANGPTDEEPAARAVPPEQQTSEDPMNARATDLANVADPTLGSIAGWPTDAIAPDVGTGSTKEDTDSGNTLGPIPLPWSSIEIEPQREADQRCAVGPCSQIGNLAGLEPMDLRIDGNPVVVRSGVIPLFLLPTPAVNAFATQKPRYMLPAPTPVLMLPIQPPGSDRSSGDGAPDSGARRHCFAARRHHSYPHVISKISSLMDPGESRLYNVLLDLCGIDLLTSLTMRRDEPFEVAVGRSVLIERVLQIKFTRPELEAIGGDKKRNSRETENARTEIKNATKGLAAKRLIDCLHPAEQPYRDRITYRVFISHQVLSRLSEIGAAYWRASGPGRILVDSNGEDIRIETLDHGASKYE